MTANYSTYKNGDDWGIMMVLSPNHDIYGLLLIYPHDCYYSCYHGLLSEIVVIIVIPSPEMKSLQRKPWSSTGPVHDPLLAILK